MTAFDGIPNKRPAKRSEKMVDLWPELGENFALNQFYRNHSCAEGWLGERYLAVWTQQEVLRFRAPNLEAYPEKYHFFASDGGGTQFGFFAEDGLAAFVSAPDIGSEDDIRVLGNWDQLLKSIETGDYI